MLYATLKPLALALFRLLWRLRARQTHHVPPEGPVLLVANHSSVLDPPLIAAMTPRPVWFMAKAELFAIPGLGGLIRRLNARPVRREAGDAGALRSALRVLEEGGVLLMFPEGTRGAEGVLRPPKPGAALLAALSGAPVVPVHITGSGRAWPRGRRLPRPGKVTVVFGPPLRIARVAGAGRKELYDAAGRAMMEAIARLAPAGGPGAPAAATLPAVGGAAVRTTGGPPKFIDGRNGRHGEG